MHLRHRFLIAVLAALVFLAPGAFAGSRNKPPQANARKAKKIKPYKAPILKTKSNVTKPNRRAR
jgi:hypothetical protein